MATSTVSPPISFAGVGTAGLNYAFVHAQQRLLMAMEDTLDVVGENIASLKGDLGGTGSDTIRIAEVDNIGFSRRMSSLASESDTITPSAVTLGYTTLTVGMYGLGHKETYNNQVLGLSGNRVGIEDLMAVAPASWAATVRYLVAALFPSISTAIGSASRALNADDWLAVCTAARETLGSDRNGMPISMLAPQQVTQLVNAFRTEPAYQTAVAALTELARPMGQTVRNFAGLGVDIAMTDDVTQSGGAYQGAAFSPGAVGWGRASTDRIRPTGAGRAIYMPAMGAFLQEHDAGQNGQALYEMRAWIGAALASSNVFLQRRVISLV